MSCNSCGKKHDGLIEKVECLYDQLSSLQAVAEEQRKALEAFESWWRRPNSERTIENIEPAMRLCLAALSLTNSEALAKREPQP